MAAANNRRKPCLFLFAFFFLWAECRGRPLPGAAVQSCCSRPRQVTRKVVPEPVIAHGALLRVPFGQDSKSDVKYLDPFISLIDFNMTPPAGFGDHPHLGFDTITYMLEGGLAYRDHGGHSGVDNVGDVQWMRASRGLIHSELPAYEGVNRGVQLWLNLPAKQKRIEPQYIEILQKDVVVTKDVKVVEVRQLHDHDGIAELAVTPSIFLDATMEPGSEWNHAISEGYTVFAYVLEGEGVFGSADAPPASAQNFLVMGRGDGLRAWNKGSQRLRFLVGAAQPLNEPMVQYKTFVLSTQAEVQQAIDDYRNRRNGFAGLSVDEIDKDY